MENNKELFAKAKAAETPEALLTLAKENGMEMTEESAAAYFEIMHPKAGELADEELNNVSGGGCRKSDGRLIVSAGYSCGYWECKRCGVRATRYSGGISGAEYAESCRIAITAIGALLKKGFGFAITRTNERIQT